MEHAARPEEPRSGVSKDGCGSRRGFDAAQPLLTTNGFVRNVMNPLVDADYFLTLANQTMWVLALAAAPILIPALLSGLILGMVQAATSIQEQTLSFVPKLIVVAVSIMVFGAMILGLLSDFTNEIFARIPDLVR
jgi:flagellar biosynthetic protein FliQ